MPFTNSECGSTMKNGKNEAEKWPTNVATRDGTRFVDIEAQSSTNSTFNMRQFTQINKKSKSIRSAMIYRRSTFYAIPAFLFHTIASTQTETREKREVIFGREKFNFTIVNAKSNFIGTLTICVKEPKWMTLFPWPFCCLAAFTMQQRVPLNLRCVWFSINIPFFVDELQKFIRF